MTVDLHHNALYISLLTRNNAPHVITDTAQTLSDFRFIPCFGKDTLRRDSTRLDRFVYVHPMDTRSKAPKQMELTVLYTQHSAGTSSMQTRKYLLRRRSNYWFAVH
jgi:hypothetical protein